MCQTFDGTGTKIWSKEPNTPLHSFSPQLSITSPFYNIYLTTFFQVYIVLYCCTNNCPIKKNVVSVLSTNNYMERRGGSSRRPAPGPATTRPREHKCSCLIYWTNRAMLCRDCVGFTCISGYGYLASRKR